ncbi:MAG: DUF296 domain-containing protein [Acetobacteraceae bacterium]|nr:DUF296 domain-containing protein [Acetobacteraceae bacterium]
MRRLIQPGPPPPQRIDSFATTLRKLRFALQPGLTLNQAVTGPLVAAGFQSAALRFTGGGLDPFHYVLPGPPDGPSHVAWFSTPHAPAGETRLEQANVTFGWAADGTPFLHCHAAWTEPDGARRGGHILPHEAVVATPATVDAWGSADVRIAAAPDAETNFPLFQPYGTAGGQATGVVARVRPNEDITLAVEAIARRHGLRDAVLRGSLGSLVGARFTDGRTVADHATEVLVQHGRLSDGIAALDLLVVDMQGAVHRGTLARGENAVCITFELVLEAA